MSIRLVVAAAMFVSICHAQQRAVQCHSGGTQPSIPLCEQQDRERAVQKPQVIQCHSGGTQPSIPLCEQQDRERAVKKPQIIQCHSGGTQPSIPLCEQQDRERAVQKPQVIRCHSGGTQPSIPLCEQQDRDRASKASSVQTMQGGTPAATAQCWLYPNGNTSPATANSTPPVVGARLGACNSTAPIASSGANPAQQLPATSLAVRGATMTQSYACKNCIGNGKYHTGVDYAAPSGTPVLAVRAGTVSNFPMGAIDGSPDNHCMGNIAILKANDGSYFVYAHLSGFSKNGQVAAGDQIGQVGDTGYNSSARTSCQPSTRQGPHLHLEKKRAPQISDSTGSQWGYTTAHPDGYGYSQP